MSIVSIVLAAITTLTLGVVPHFVLRVHHGIVCVSIASFSAAKSRLPGASGSAWNKSRSACAPRARWTTSSLIARPPTLPTRVGLTSPAPDVAGS